MTHSIRRIRFMLFIYFCKLIFFSMAISACNTLGFHSRLSFGRAAYGVVIDTVMKYPGTGVQLVLYCRTLCRLYTDTKHFVWHFLYKTHQTFSMSLSLSLYIRRANENMFQCVTHWASSCDSILLYALCSVQTLQRANRISINCELLLTFLILAGGEGRS